MARGARNTAVRARPIAGSTHSSNARQHVQGTVDFARTIHSHPLPPNREGAIDVTVRKNKVPARSRHWIKIISSSSAAPKPGNHTAETELRSWGGRTRTRK